MRILPLLFLFLSLHSFSQNIEFSANTDTIYEWRIYKEKDSSLVSRKIILPDNTFEKTLYSDGEEFMRTINRNIENNLPIPGWEDKYTWLKLDSIKREEFYEYDEFGFPEFLNIKSNLHSTRERIEKIYKETEEGWKPITINYPSEKFQFEYDEQNNLVQIVKYNKSNIPERIYTFHNNKIKTKASRYRVIEEYTYNNDDQLIRKEDRHFIYLYNYNDSGEISEIVKLLKSSKIKREITEFHYSDNGNLKSVKTYKFAKKGSEKILLDQTIYTSN